MDLSVYWYGGQTPRVEPLRGDVKSEVVVGGGGMAGLTCAQSLVARGVDVTVVEQAFCGAGASGKSSGFITPDTELELSDLVSNYGEMQGQALWEFARAGLERIRRTIEDLAIDCDYRVQDSLFVARTARAFRKVIEAEHRIYEGTPAMRLSGRGVETPSGTVTAATVAVLTDRALPALGLAAPAVYHVQTFLAISRPLRAGEIRVIGDR